MGGATNTSGIAGTISIYSPWVHPVTGQHNSNVSAWVMLAYLAPGPPHFAQIGWIEYPYGERDVFDEYTYNNTGAYIKDFYPKSDPGWVNSSHRFVTLYGNPSVPWFSVWMDGTMIKQFKTDFVPANNQMFGETHTYADQMAGGVTHPEDFSDVLVHIIRGGWVNADLNPVDDDRSQYNIAKYSATHLQIGDKKCLT